MRFKVPFGLQLLSFLLLWLFFPQTAEAYTRFQYQLTGTPKNYRVDWVFIDLFDTPKSTITRFKNQGKKVICYFSAGTYEDWREDQGRFPSSVKGNDLDDWQGEQWLDTRSKTVENIMISRMDKAKQKGCNGVDLDNVDGYGNDTGFRLSQTNSIQFLKKMANAARAKGLLIGLKNSSEIAGHMSNFLNFAIVEECLSYNECQKYNSFVSKQKPVFIIEYGSVQRAKCNKIDKLGMNLSFFNEELDGRTYKVCH